MGVGRTLDLCSSSKSLVSGSRSRKDQEEECERDQEVGNPVENGRGRDSLRGVDEDAGDGSVNVVGRQLGIDKRMWEIQDCPRWSEDQMP